MAKELEQLALSIRTYCGIDFTNNLTNLELKTTRRLTELNLSLTDYIAYLGKTPIEWDKLVEAITINETYFFREFGQLDAFQQLLKERKNKSINVWCIPCSTGEEAYSLAIMAKEIEQETGNRVRIIGSDLNKKVLDTAKKGVYPKNSLSFRRMPTDKNYLEKYFTETESGYEIIKEIKEMVSFETFNLKDYHTYAKYNQIDFIFCRNVLFYFNEEIVQTIIEKFHQILNDEGFLFLGHAESISHLKTKFSPTHTHDSFYYTKER